MRAGVRRFSVDATRARSVAYGSLIDSGTQADGAHVRQLEGSSHEILDETSRAGDRVDVAVHAVAKAPHAGPTMVLSGGSPG